MVAGSGPLDDPGLIGDGQQVAAALRDGSWVEGGLAVAQTGLDAAFMAIDPIGTLLAAGLGFLMDHVEPLKRWLDDLTGDPGAVGAHAATWGSIAQGMQTAGEDLVSWVNQDLDAMAGASIDAYRASASQTAGLLSGAAGWASAMSNAEQVASMLVSTVHDLVRDVLAQLVGDLITWAAELAFTFGLATPLVIEQCATRVAGWAATLGRRVDGLVTSLERLGGKADELEGLFGRAGRSFDRLASHEGAGLADDIGGDMRAPALQQPHLNGEPEGGILPLGRDREQPETPPKPVSPPGRVPPSTPTVGDADGGAGAWVKTQSRGAGADYQERITGVLRNPDGTTTEYRLAYDQNAKGYVDFDGHVWRGQPPEEVFLDAKDGYTKLLIDQPWAEARSSQLDKFLKEAQAQLGAIRGSGSEGRMEWHFSSEESARIVQEFFAESNVNIHVHFTP